MSTNDEQSKDREGGFEDKTDWTRAALSYRAREDTIQLSATATCPFLDILLQQIAESYRTFLLGNLTQPRLQINEANALTTMPDH